MKDADRRGTPLEPQEPVRLQKTLAEAGLGSRREIEGWIREGRVRVNGELAKLGDRVMPSDRIRVDGQEVRRRAAKRHSVRVLAYHKPEGEVVTRKDPEGRPTIFRRLPGIRDGRWIAVGRLDLNTAGLLLVTNHGELANRLMHPSRALEREYAVRVRGSVSDDLLAQLVNGVELEDGPARFEEIVPSGGSESHQWFHVLIVEGRNREVRRLWEAVGCSVSRLKRVRYGNVILGARPTPGQWREVVGEELDELMALAELGPPVAGRSGLSTGSDKGSGARGSAKPRAVGSPRLAGRGLKPRPSGRR
ncbi:23S rRNA pseudouridine(2605) synthase RluB [Halochromatium roseum]|uniref:23S rRNA pseudouridine(2605) synthase RluB n=1 Tax=Halochromatium roseum TaxID=391920 RepID=UPI001912C61D|nr:pseudouridine synthase [Halochromatium roseum]MBK5939702.1 23S rRNA pseudouridylate synthase B [Halochromatium roseum]